MLKKARCTVDWRSIRDLNSGGATNALSHFESLKLLDEAGPSRLSLAAEGILVTSKKARHTAICRQNQLLFAK